MTTKKKNPKQAPIRDKGKVLKLKTGIKAGAEKFHEYLR